MQLYKAFEPLVSVIIPTFNRSSYLHRAINSVINQSFKKWELIIVDDGSDDDTYAKVNGFQNKNENIRYMRHTNRKPPLSLNAGILAAAGEFITFLGSDDEYKTDHLESRLKLFEEDPAREFIHGGVEIIGYPFVKDKNNLANEIHISECAVGGTFFARKKVFLEMDGFRNLAYSDDSDFLERVSQIYNINKCALPTYIYYRDTPDSICTNIE